MRSVQSDHKAASRLLSSNFRRFRAYLMAFKRIIPPQLRARSSFIVHAKRVQVPMIRKSKFSTVSKVSLITYICQVCANWICAIGSCFSYLCLCLIVAMDLPNTCFACLPGSASRRRRSWSRGQSQQLLLCLLLLLICRGWDMEGSCVFIYHRGWVGFGCVHWSRRLLIAIVQDFMFSPRIFKGA
jgi:hypothetical protein